MSRAHAVAVGVTAALLVAGAAWWLAATDGGALRDPGAAVASSAPAAVDPARALRPNVLLVTIDTLRADHVSSNGYGRRTTPFLDAVAADGVRFARAYSTSSWTVPGVVSLLSGTAPSAHGVVHGRAEQGKIRGQEVVPDDLPWLAAELRAAGYRTFAVTANTHLAGELGFARGFDRYACVGFAPARRVERALEPMLEAIHGGRGPWLVWLHLFDPHMPYRPREPFLTELWPAPRPRHPDLERLRAPHAPLDEPVEGDRLAYLTALYDAEIRFADAALRRLTRALGADDALVVVTSDHGEELMEHGGLGHGQSLHPEVIAVPLVIRRPDRRGAGSVIAEPVSLVDVLPTVLAELGLPVPSGVSGQELFGEPRDRPIVAELSRGGPLRALIEGDLQLVDKPGEGARLFALRDDPAPAAELTDERPGDVERMRARLDRYLAGVARTDAPRVRELSPEEVAQLRALGYVGGD